MAGMARAMGTTLTRAQKLLDKNKNFYLQFIETLLYFAPHKTASTQRSRIKCRACDASTTKDYDKTIVL